MDVGVSLRRCRRHVPRSKGFLKPVSIGGTLGLGSYSVLCDFNGVVVDDENHQMEAWLEAIQVLFGNVATSDQLDRAEVHVRWSFKTGQFHEFRRALWEIFGPCAPQGIVTALDLDHALSAHRDERIKRCVEVDHTVRASDGVERLLRDFCSRGIKVGLFSANGQDLVNWMLDKFFGAEAARRFFPPHWRLFGKTLPEGVRSKPHSDGYRLLARMMNVLFDTCIIIEDRLEVIQRSLRDGAQGAVWVCNKKDPAALWNRVRCELGKMFERVILVPTPEIILP